MRNIPKLGGKRPHPGKHEKGLNKTTNEAKIIDKAKKKKKSK